MSLQRGLHERERKAASQTGLCWHPCSTCSNITEESIYVFLSLLPERQCWGTRQYSVLTFAIPRPLTASRTLTLHTSFIDSSGSFPSSAHSSWGLRKLVCFFREGNTLLYKGMVLVFVYQVGTPVPSGPLFSSGTSDSRSVLWALFCLLNFLRDSDTLSSRVELNFQEHCPPSVAKQQPSQWNPLSLSRAVFAACSLDSSSATLQTVGLGAISLIIRTFSRKRTKTTGRLKIPYIRSSPVHSEVHHLGIGKGLGDATYSRREESKAQTAGGSKNRVHTGRQQD